jgi:hypothetical protein
METTTKFTSENVQYAVTLQWRDESTSVEYFNNGVDAEFYFNYNILPREGYHGRLAEPSAIYGIIENNFSNRVTRPEGTSTRRSVGDAITGEGELSHYVEYENNQI